MLAFTDWASDFVLFRRTVGNRQFEYFFTLLTFIFPGRGEFSETDRCPGRQSLNVDTSAGRAFYLLLCRSDAASLR